MAWARFERASSTKTTHNWDVLQTQTTLLPSLCREGDDRRYDIPHGARKQSDDDGMDCVARGLSDLDALADSSRKNENVFTCCDAESPEPLSLFPTMTSTTTNTVHRRLSARKGSVSAPDPHAKNAHLIKESSSILTIVRVAGPPAATSPAPPTDTPPSPRRPPHRRLGSNPRASPEPAPPGRLSFAFSSFGGGPPSPGTPGRPSSPQRTSSFNVRPRLSPEQLLEVARTATSPPPPAAVSPAVFTPLPADVYLPFLDRPTEVAHLFATAPTAKLFALLAHTFPRGADNKDDDNPAKWSHAQLTAFLTTTPRTVASDAEYVSLARRAIRPRSELIWERLKGALGVPPELDRDDAYEEHAQYEQQHADVWESSSEEGSRSRERGDGDGPALDSHWDDWDAVMESPVFNPSRATTLTPGASSTPGATTPSALALSSDAAPPHITTQLPTPQHSRDGDGDDAGKGHFTFSPVDARPSPFSPVDGYAGEDAGPLALSPNALFIEPVLASPAFQSSSAQGYFAGAVPHAVGGTGSPLVTPAPMGDLGDIGEEEEEEEEEGADGDAAKPSQEEQAVPEPEPAQIHGIRISTSSAGLPNPFFDAEQPALDVGAGEGLPSASASANPIPPAGIPLAGGTGIVRSPSFGARRQSFGAASPLRGGFAFGVGMGMTPMSAGGMSRSGSFGQGGGGSLSRSGSFGHHRGSGSAGSGGMMARSGSFGSVGYAKSEGAGGSAPHTPYGTDAPQYAHDPHGQDAQDTPYTHDRDAHDDAPYDPVADRAPGNPLFPSNFARLAVGPTLAANNPALRSPTLPPQSKYTRSPSWGSALASAPFNYNPSGASAHGHDSTHDSAAHPHAHAHDAPAAAHPHAKTRRSSSTRSIERGNRFRRSWVGAGGPVEEYAVSWSGSSAGGSVRGEE
ncbi:hypothetical protein C8J57DRAFT_1578089 [Mycena rebaudengoi]|nr:hypothetical protein C8J57DRAFT_1578089 [Mycena rebaudengoi]